ncbi:Farnesyl diphosphate synthase [Candidatus Providencia siddallii]|uniref:Farnesyl diphosphate synthase n=1 Tax=Candidatus Providencia siddallii TaxID=1715285 RepID=A0A0M6W728_9GAMM|nr:Farnesyl diphosphate synthase [Candidatus Providencia siddallii]
MNNFVFYQKKIYNRINKYLLRIFNKLSLNNSPLVEVMKYGALFGGKRLRPFLTYAVGSMLGLNKKNLDAPAAAVECIHAYSLIHDDLPAMDNDLLRRNKPSCHIKYGEYNAILAGNALQSLAFQLLSTENLPDVKDKDRIIMIAELAQSSGVSGMCGGQSLDIYTKDKDIDSMLIEYIYQHKTVAIIRTAIRLGAYAAGENGRRLIPTLDKYAESIGFAFQVQDDILDFKNKNDLINKQNFNSKHSKNTYTKLLGLKLSKKKINDLHHDAITALDQIQNFNYNTSMLKAITNFIIKRKN